MPLKREKVKKSTEIIVVTAMLTAVVVALQTFASVISIGTFKITLSLLPIALGAILYGSGVGAILGFAFGVVVCIQVVTGVDVGGFLMFQQLPVLTLVLCLLKSTAAGFASGVVYKLISKKNDYVGMLVSAIVCPVVNTGILCLGMLLFYNSLVTGWAIGDGYTTAIAYILFGMVGINFLIELGINVVLNPALARIAKAVRKMRSKV